MLFFSHCFKYHSDEISDQILISLAHPAIPLKEFAAEPLCPIEQENSLHR